MDLRVLARAKNAREARLLLADLKMPKSDVKEPKMI